MYYKMVGVKRLHNPDTCHENMKKPSFLQVSLSISHPSLLGTLLLFVESKSGHSTTSYVAFGTLTLKKKFLFHGVC